MTTNEGRRKRWPPGKTNHNRTTSNPIAVRKTGAARRERRHVRAPAARYVQLHARANSAARGEVFAVLGQAAQNPAIPARPAARSPAPSTMIPNGLPSISPNPPVASNARVRRRECVRSGRTPYRSSCIENAFKRLVHGLLSRQCVGHLSLDENDVRALARPPHILAANATLHRSEIELSPHVVTWCWSRPLHRTFAHAVWRFSH